MLGFVEKDYGKTKVVDLHTMTLDEAIAEIIYQINSVDIDIKNILLVHGYKNGTVLKDYIRKEFKHGKVTTIKNIDASCTLLVLKRENGDGK